MVSPTDDSVICSAVSKLFSFWRCIIGAQRSIPFGVLLQLGGGLGSRWPQRKSQSPPGLAEDDTDKILVVLHPGGQQTFRAAFWLTSWLVLPPLSWGRANAALMQVQGEPIHPQFWTNKIVRSSIAATLFFPRTHGGNRQRAAPG
jgi:hypothetical protein